MPAFSAPLDLRKNELRNAVTQNLGTAPPAPVPGLRYYDTVTNLEQFWDGTKWVALSDVINAGNITGLGDLALLNQVGPAEIIFGAITDYHISSSAAIDLAKLAIDPLARANHTGTQLAVTVSDFDAQVRTNPLNLMATPLASVSMGGQTITNLGTPVNAGDAVTKAYADMVATGLDVKDAVQAAAGTNIDLAAPGAAIDDVTLAAGDRVLVMEQTAATDNGIYVFNGAAAAMTRAPDADSDAEVSNGMFCFVTAGTEFANSGWLMNTPDPVTLGTTPLNFVQFSGSGGAGAVTGTPNRITVTGGQIDIAWTYAGQASLTTLGTVTTGVWNATPIDIAHGGTGATTAADARLALGTIGKYTTTIGNGTAKTFTITHGLNTKLVGVEMYEVATGQTVYADVRRTTVNDVVIDGFNVAPTSGALDVIIWG
jgi:hypothetical protein